MFVCVMSWMGELTVFLHIFYFIYSTIYICNLFLGLCFKGDIELCYFVAIKQSLTKQPWVNKYSYD